MSKFTAEGFFDFVKAQSEANPGQKIWNDTRESSPVGDYIRSVDPDWYDDPAHYFDIPIELEAEIALANREVYRKLNLDAYDTYGELAAAINTTT